MSHLLKYESYMVKFDQTRPQCTSVLSIFPIPLSPVALAIVFYNYNIGVCSLNVRNFIKPSHHIESIIIYKDEFVNSSITGKQFGGICVCNPCECRVNLV